MNQTLEIHIEQLVLHGFSPQERRRISAAVESELTRLFTEKGIPSSLLNGGSVPVLQGDHFLHTANTGGRITGSNIAGSVYTSLEGGTTQQNSNASGEAIK